jgi:TPR repeat protein|eukprot:COSAG01_NODE_1255_length_11040_cov_67.549584_7_plen_108_part_00
MKYLQANAGSLLKLADYSYYGLGTDVDYEQSAAYYMQASEMRSAQVCGTCHTAACVRAAAAAPAPAQRRAAQPPCCCAVQRPVSFPCRSRVDQVASSASYNPAALVA